MPTFIWFYQCVIAIFWQNSCTHSILNITLGSRISTHRTSDFVDEPSGDRTLWTSSQELATLFIRPIDDFCFYFLYKELLLFFPRADAFPFTKYQNESKNIVPPSHTAAILYLLVLNSPITGAFLLYALYTARKNTVSDRSMTSLVRNVLWEVRFRGYSHRILNMGSIGCIPYTVAYEPCSTRCFRPGKLLTGFCVIVRWGQFF